MAVDADRRAAARLAVQRLTPARVKVSAHAADKCCMVDSRCPNCSARVPAEADWCSLCYASLRVQVAAPEPQFVPPADPAFTPAAPAYAAAGPTTAYNPLTAPIATLAPPAGPAAPTADIAGEPRATWPCGRCESAVPIELDTCDSCGASFLHSGDADLRLPLIGNLKDIDSGKKAWIMVGGSLGLIVVFLLVSFVLSLVF